MNAILSYCSPELPIKEMSNYLLHEILIDAYTQWSCPFRIVPGLLNSHTVWWFISTVLVDLAISVQIFNLGLRSSTSDSITVRFVSHQIDARL